MKKKQNNWKKWFREEFYDHKNGITWIDDGKVVILKDIEEFIDIEIKQLLKVQNQDLVDKIKKMGKDEKTTGFGWAFNSKEAKKALKNIGYNQALKDIQNLTKGN